MEEREKVDLIKNCPRKRPPRPDNPGMFVINLNCYEYLRIFDQHLLNTDFHSRYNRQINTTVKRSRLSPRFYLKAMEPETVFVIFQLPLR